MSSGTGKRNYVCRKKYLHDSILQIKATLEFISAVCGEKGTNSYFQSEATAHAKSIEADCWSPHSRLSAERYQRLMTSKTQELCRALIFLAMPSVNLSNLQKQMFPVIPGRAKTPQPSLPIPVIEVPVFDRDCLQETEWGIGVSDGIEMATDKATLIDTDVGSGRPLAGEICFDAGFGHMDRDFVNPGSPFST